jgi:hypothetical protein
MEEMIMKHRIGRMIVLSMLGAMTFLSISSAEEPKMKPEAYSGTAIGTGGSVGGRTIQFDVRITRYTTDEEVKGYAELVKEKGPDALRSALEKEDVRRISPTGSVGNQIAAARKRQQGQDTIITIVTSRIMPLVELNRGGRSTDYQFGFMQLKLNAKGEGTGQIMAAARIRFDKKKGQYEIESYGNQYINAINVRTWK